MILQSRVGKNPRAKLIQFHENQRPAYWGTWSKQSSAVTGRKPFGRDTQVRFTELFINNRGNIFFKKKIIYLFFRVKNLKKIFSMILRK